MREQVVQHPCNHCNGSGYKLYGSGATWQKDAFIASTAMTPDICDKCWGSGDCKNSWLNLRKLGVERKEAGRRIHKLVTQLEKESAKNRKK